MMIAPAHCPVHRLHAEPITRSGPAAIVYVEDNAVNALLFETVIALHAPWSLTIVPDGASALALLEELTPDLLVIDAHLPDTDGLALIGRIRALRPALADVPAVMFTADGMADQVAASRAAGFIEHWVKPMDTRQMIASMRRLLDA